MSDADIASIDRLIEEGLNRYGTGDLDGALLAWEEALAIDPENAQANSYVDYVRLNYDVLQSEGGTELAVDDGYGIADEPDYVIEIVPGEIVLEAEPPPPMYMDPLDEGWFIEEEATRDLGREVAAPRTVSAEPLMLELEADEPPLHEAEANEPPPHQDDGVSFEDATREYGSNPHATNDFLDDPSSFRAEATPLGFGQMETEIKKRDLGFVQPTQGPARLEVRLRSPSSPPPPGGDLELGDAGGESHATTRGLPPIHKAPAAVDDLIDSLPSPRPGADPADANQKVTPVRGSRTTSDPAVRSTRDLPEPTRPPAGAGASLEDDGLGLGPSGDPRERTPAAPASPSAFGSEPIVAAPTRELGLRPGGRAPSVYPDEDAPTRQSDARAIRADAAARMAASAADIGDGTRQDIVLPFDPMDARTAQILDEIDDEMPGEEPGDDRTRRRITALLDRAMAWNSQMELDKAVTAVDLALSEDPDSALAQKLIHRNRDTIMTVFQNFLGDLDRQPQLARPLHELGSAPISPRAAFLLSRIDGMLSIDEILDVSGHAAAGGVSSPVPAVPARHPALPASAGEPCKAAMPIRKVVLAYSGGLDTCVAVSLDRRDVPLRGRLLLRRRRPGRGSRGRAPKALAVGANKAVVRDLRLEFVRDYVWPALRAGALYEGQYLLGHVAGAAVHRPRADGGRRRRGRRRDRARLDRQGQRPGPVRARRLPLPARDQDHRAVARVDVQGPPRADRLHQAARHPDRGHRRQAVLGRPQPPAHQLRGWHARGSVARARPGDVPAHPRSARGAGPRRA